MNSTIIIFKKNIGSKKCFLNLHSKINLRTLSIFAQYQTFIKFLIMSLVYLRSSFFSSAVVIYFFLKGQITLRTDDRLTVKASC